MNDRTHGQQFRARFIRTGEPSSVEGIEKYFGSGMIRGIGPVYARKLVRTFGEKVLDVIARRRLGDPAASPPRPDPMRHEPCRLRCPPSRLLGRHPAQRWDHHPKGHPQGPLSIRSCPQFNSASCNRPGNQLRDVE